VIVCCVQASINMLRRVEPYIAYGYANQKSVRELIYKRGCGKVNGQRIPLTDNHIIEKALGSKVCAWRIAHWFPVPHRLAAVFVAVAIWFCSMDSLPLRSSRAAINRPICGFGKIC
jgi:hypothetical protein